MFQQCRGVGLHNALAAPHAVARRVGAPRKLYARVLYRDPDATLDDLREVVATLEELERIARRVFGGAHPLKVEIERELRRSRAKLRARETPPTKGES